MRATTLSRVAWHTHTRRLRSTGAAAGRQRRDHDTHHHTHAHVMGSFMPSISRCVSNLEPTRTGSTPLPSLMPDLVPAGCVWASVHGHHRRVFQGAFDCHRQLRLPATWPAAAARRCGSTVVRPQAPVWCWRSALCGCTNLGRSSASCARLRGTAAHVWGPPGRDSWHQRRPPAGAGGTHGSGGPRGAVWALSAPAWRLRAPRTTGQLSDSGTRAQSTTTAARNVCRLAVAESERADDIQPHQ
jgi:hypothetical protein